MMGRNAFESITSPKYDLSVSSRPLLGYRSSPTTAPMSVPPNIRLEKMRVPCCT